MLALLLSLLISVPVSLADPPHATEEILVRFREGAGEMVGDMGMVVMQQRQLHHQRVRIAPNLGLKRLLEQYRQRPDVLWAEPNYLHFLDFVPDDPLYSEQQAYLDIIRVPEAWDRHTGSAEVVIAVLDSGIALRHPELADNIWTNPDELPGNGIDDDKNGYVDDLHGWDFVGDDPGDALNAGEYPDDPDPDVRAGDPAIGNGVDDDQRHGPDSNVFHGTFVAGLLAAIGDNSRGIAGVTWRCRIMPLRIFPPDGGAFSSDIAEAIAYAAKNGASVVSLSFSSTVRSQAVAEAIEEAYEAGVIFVASVGNENADVVRYPAALPQVIAVSASDDAVEHPYQRASFSNWGAYVDVVAPGVNIVSTGVVSQAESLAGEGTPGEPIYRTHSGTSFSSPLVAGLAAWHRSENPNQSPEGIRAIIREQTLNLPDDPDDSPDAGAGWAGFGLIQFLHSEVAQVQFEQFAAHETVEGIEVTWITALEQGIQSFTVEGTHESIGEPTTQVVSSLPHFPVISVPWQGAQTVYRILDASSVPPLAYRLVAYGSQGETFYSEWFPVIPGVVPPFTELLPNYPNPFNPDTWIPYRLATPGRVEIRIHSVDGRLVAQFDLGYRDAGEYLSQKSAFHWDGRNLAGEIARSGIYFCTLHTENATITRRLLLGR